MFKIEKKNPTPTPVSDSQKIKGLTMELLKERITRIEFQMQLLGDWRQRCQQELAGLLEPESPPAGAVENHG